MVSFLVSPANDLMECSVPCRLIISLFIQDRDQLSTDKSSTLFSTSRYSKVLTRNAQYCYLSAHGFRGHNCMTFSDKIDRFF